MYHFLFHINSGPLLEMLKKDDKNLEDILTQEAVFQEMKSNNQDLIDYFLQNDIFKQLINYVTKIPSSPNTVNSIDQPNKDNKANKFPYNACEILSCDSNKLIKYMFGLSSNNEDKDKTNDELNYQDSQEDEIRMNDDGELINNQPLNNIYGTNTIGNEDNKTISEELESVSLNQSKPILTHPIDMLLNFVNSEHMLNPTLAGYFAKVLRNLFYNRPILLLDYIYTKKPIFFEHMAEHLYSDSIAEVLSTLIKLDHTLYKTPNGKYYYTDIRKKIVEKIVNNLRLSYKSQSKSLFSIKFDEDYEYIFRQNSSNLLCSLIQNQNYNAAEELIKPLVNSDILEIFKETLDFIKSTQENPNQVNVNERRFGMAILTPIFQLVNTICESLFEPSDSMNSNSNFMTQMSHTSYGQNTFMLNINTQSDSSSICPPSGFDIGDFVDKIVNILPNMSKCLLDNDNVEEITEVQKLEINGKNEDMIVEDNKNTHKVTVKNSSYNIIDFRFGYRTKPFGQYKIKLLELFYTFLRLNKASINTRVAELNYLKILLDAFISENWNNILHNIVLKILTWIINSKSEILLKSLFEDAQLLTFIIKATVEPDFILSSKLQNKVRKGYLGHVVKLSNIIEDSKDSYIKKIRDETQGWSDFKQDFLKKSNTNNSVKIGGLDPREVHSHSSNAFFISSTSSHFGVNIHQESGSTTSHSGDKHPMDIEKDQEIEEITEDTGNQDDDDINDKEEDKDDDDDDDDKVDKPEEKEDGGDQKNINYDDIADEERISQEPIKSLNSKQQYPNFSNGEDKINTEEAMNENNEDETQGEGTNDVEANSEY